MSNQANEGLYVYVDLRYMGMYKTLKVYIFVIEHDTEIIQVLLYSLDRQLSFDSLHFVFIQYRNV